MKQNGGEGCSMKRQTLLLCLILLLGTSSFPGATHPWREEPAPQRMGPSLRYVPHPARATRLDSEEVLRWARTYGDADTDEAAYSIIQTVDGGYAFAGAKGGATWLVKTDTRGKEEWTHTYDGPSAHVLLQTADGGFAFAGSAGWSLSPQAEIDVWLWKTDTRGVVQWRRNYERGNINKVGGVIQTSDGGFVLAGYTYSWESREGREGDGWLWKTDANGDMEWNQTYGGPEPDSFSGMIQTVDSGFALTGWSGGDAWLVKINAQGMVQWDQTYGGSVPYAVIQLTDGSFILIGTKGGNAWLSKTNVDGTLEWQQTCGGPETDYIYAGIQTMDGGFVLTGYTESYGAGGRDAWLVKTDAQGGVQWNRTYGGAQHDYAFSVIETADGGYALAGATDSYGAGESDVWLIKTDVWGVAPKPAIPLPRWVVLSVGGSLALFVVITVVIWMRKKRQ